MSDEHIRRTFVSRVPYYRRFLSCVCARTMHSVGAGYAIVCCPSVRPPVRQSGVTLMYTDYNLGSRFLEFYYTNNIRSVYYPSCLHVQL